MHVIRKDTYSAVLHLILLSMAFSRSSKYYTMLYMHTNNKYLESRINRSFVTAFDDSYTEARRAQCR